MKLKLMTRPLEKGVGHLWHGLIRRKIPNDFIEFVDDPQSADRVLTQTNQPHQLHHGEIYWHPQDYPIAANRVQRPSFPYLSVWGQTIDEPAINSFRWNDYHVACLNYARSNKSEPLYTRLDRPIDVFMLHLSGSYADDRVNRHRSQALAAMQEVPPEVIRLSGRIPSIKDRIKSTYFWSLMAQSKIVVSPDGYGPGSAREYEALALGCIVIKPHSIWNLEHGFRCYSWPDVADCGSNVWCSSNFNNLGEVIYKTLRRWKPEAPQRIAQAEAYHALTPNDFFERLRRILEHVSQP